MRDLRFAREALAALAVLRPPAVDERRAVDAAVAAARDLEARLTGTAARCPSVAFAGAVDSGKALLINALCGFPGLLTVPATAATAVTTVLRIDPAPPGSRPAVRSAAVTYLSDDEVARRASDLVERIAELITARRQPFDPGPLQDPTTGLPGWSAIADLAEHCRWGDPDLRRACFDLMTLLNAVSAGRLLLSTGGSGGGPTGGSTARTALDPRLLAATAARSQQPPGQPPARRTAPPVRPGAPLDAASLVAVLPVIRELSLEIALPPHVWPVHGPIELVDLPDLPDLDGVGPGGTGTEAARSRLARASAVVLVVPAGQPGSDGVARLVRTLGDACRPVLVAANRFDEVPPPPRVPAGAAELLNPARSPALAELHRMVADVADAPDRALTLTSGLAHAALTGSPPWGPTNPDDLRRAADHLSRWKPVGDAVRAADPGHPLGEAIAAVVADGGIDRLRRSIVAQVSAAQVAAGQVAAGQTAAGQTGAGPPPAGSAPGHEVLKRRLRSALEDVVGRTAPHPAPSAVVDEGDRAALTTLCRTVRDLVTVYRDGLADLRMLCHGTPWGAGPISQLLRPDAAVLVHSWDVWTNTLRHAVSGRIEIPEPAAGRPSATGPGGAAPPGRASDAGEAGEAVRSGFRVRQRQVLGPASPAAVTTDSFRGPFEDTLPELHLKGRRELGERLNAWGRQAFPDPGTARLPLPAAAATALARHGHLMRAALARRLPAVQVAERMLDLELLTDPDLLTELFAGHEDAVERFAGSAFPLPAGQALPWHPLVARHPDREREDRPEQRAGQCVEQCVEQWVEQWVEQDVQRLFRLRRDLVGSLCTEVLRRLHAQLELTVDDLEVGLTDLDADLPGPDDVVGACTRRTDPAHRTGPTGPAADRIARLLAEDAASASPPA